MFDRSKVDFSKLLDENSCLENRFQNVGSGKDVIGDEFVQEVEVQCLNYGELVNSVLTDTQQSEINSLEAYVDDLQEAYRFYISKERFDVLKNIFPKNFDVWSDFEGATEEYSESIFFEIVSYIDSVEEFNEQEKLDFKRRLVNLIHDGNYLAVKSIKQFEVLFKNNSSFFTFLLEYVETEGVFALESILDSMFNLNFDNELDVSKFSIEDVLKLMDIRNKLKN